MGADYIPEDSFLSRCSRERTERLLRDCVAANYNSIRVWGGGYYPDDYFTISAMSWDLWCGRTLCLPAPPMS